MTAPRDCYVCGSDDTEFFCRAFDRLQGDASTHWDILKCRRCGFGWTTPPLGEKEISGYYPDSYLGQTARMIEEYKSGALTGTRSWRKETEKVALVKRFRRGGSVLDVGCAEGKFLWALGDDAWQRTGVEFDRRVVEIAEGVFPAIDYVVGDLHATALDGRVFDVVTFWHVFEHLYDPRRVLARVRELTVPGSLVVISLPNFSSLQAAWFRQHWYAFDDVPRHLYHFSPRSLELLLAEAGFVEPRRIFFSRMVNMHSLKYSTINWSEAVFGSRIPYYLLKPALMLAPLVEAATGRPGIITLISRRC